MTSLQRGKIALVARLFRDSYRLQGDDGATARAKALRHIADALDRKTLPDVRVIGGDPFVNSPTILFAALAGVGLLMPDQRTSESILRAAQDALARPDPDGSPRRRLRGRKGG